MDEKDDDDGVTVVEWSDIQRAVHEHGDQPVRIGLDLETTGFSPATEAITQIGVACVFGDGRRIVSSTLLQLPVGRVIPPRVVQLTGITTEACAEFGLAPDTALDTLWGVIGRETLLVGHSIRRFDMKFLRKALRNNPTRHIQACHLLDARCIDSCDVARAYFPKGTSCKLGDLQKRLGVVLPERLSTLHRADADALLADRVLEECVALLGITFYAARRIGLKKPPPNKQVAR